MSILQIPVVAPTQEFTSLTYGDRFGHGGGGGHGGHGGIHLGGGTLYGSWMEGYSSDEPPYDVPRKRTFG
jgi:hypothetical protein